MVRIDWLGASEFGIIELLVNRPFYLREVSEELGIAPSTVFNSVKKLEKKGIVKFSREKNRKLLSLCPESPLARQAVSTLFIFKILHSKGFPELKKGSESIGLYGSAAEGNMDKLSDIDLWVLGEKKIPLEKLGKIKNGIGRELGREVSIKAFTKESLNELKQRDKIFFNEIRYKSKILHGEPIE